jgi:hypothetical protein
MTSPNLPERRQPTVIRRRSDGTVREDLMTAHTEQPQIRDAVAHPIPQPRIEHTPVPGRATGIARTLASYGHLFRVVLPRYLLAGVALAVAAWFATGLLWATLIAAVLPLPVFVWWWTVVREQARDYRRGEAPPPPGWLGRL